MATFHSSRRRAVISCAVVTFSLASAFGSQNTTLRNFQKVDDHVYRGAQPTDDGFKELARLGIKTVVDLRQPGERGESEEKIVSDLGMRYVSIPMRGMSTPKDDQVAAALALLNNHESGPVFVHCRRGADRTGMLIAVYRISTGRWENQKALREARSYGMNPFEFAIKRYVRDFKPSAPVLSSAGGSIEGVPAILQ